MAIKNSIKVLRVKIIVHKCSQLIIKLTTQNINYESLEDKKSIKFATCSTDGRSMIWKYSNECCVSIFLYIGLFKIELCNNI